MIIAQRLEIFGKVQGVGFRAFVAHAARMRGLRGWVRNRLDGSVETLLIGEEVAVLVLPSNAGAARRWERSTAWRRCQRGMTARPISSSARRSDRSWDRSSGF